VYRLSNHNAFTGKTEVQKGYLVFTGKSKYISSKSDDWKFIKQFHEGTRLYYSKYIGQLHIFKKPLDESYFKILCNELDQHKVNNLHPALDFKQYSELTRLHPNSDKNVKNHYREFINFLVDEYHIDKIKYSETANYIDDIGPYLTPRVGLQKTTIPELPEIYLAPKKWRLMTWVISNYFVGPYPKNKKNIYYSWNGYDLGEIIKDNDDKGFLLLLILNFMIRHDSWSMSNPCNSTLNFINLVMNKGYLPF